MFYDQVPQVPNKLRDFIMSLKDGATFTIPEMRKATGVSWHTCNHFIQNWPQRFRPSIIGRGKSNGRPFVYKLLSNGPGIVKPPETGEMMTPYERLTTGVGKPAADIRAKKYRMKRVVGGGSETGGAPEIWVKEEIKMPPLKEYIESCKSDWVKEEEECKKIRSTEGWDLLPAARKINALKALFPNGVLPEQYAELFGIVEFIERVSMSLWYKRTEIQKKD